MKNLKPELEQRQRQHLYRTRRIVQSPQRPEMIIDGRRVTSFCSNDYLGLAGDESVKQAFIDGIERYGTGSGAAHLINGHSEAHHALEQALADFTGYARALLFSTGYMANLAIAHSLLEKNDAVLLDRLDHASLIDAGLFSAARFIRYRHNDAADLDHKLKQREQGDKLVQTDAVFSMDGDIADLPSLVNVCRQHNTWLMVDDAHGFGVLGDHGRGTLEHLAVDNNDVPIYMATLGKALGTAGAFVAGSDDLIETLIQKARTYIYTTASPPALAHATLTSLNLVQKQPERRVQLNDNIDYFRQCCEQENIRLTNSETAIQPVLIGDNNRTVALSEKLFEQGLLITAIRPPTVPQDSARLRITLSTLHTHEHIDRLVQSLAEALDQLPD